MSVRARCSMLRAALVAAAAILATSASAHASGALKIESGRLQDFISRLASSDYLLGDPATDHRPYIEPGAAINAIRHIAQQMAWGDVRQAAREAVDVKCEVVKFTDVTTDAVYYALREDRDKLDDVRGWGSYIYKPTGKIPALVEIPHPIADANTRGIGAAVFVAADAKGFLLAGAHRDKADVPDLVDSAFHQVHMAWVGPFAQNAAWQIHGFESQKHEFPTGASVIASTGDGAVVPELSHLNSMAEKRGLDVYVFNDLSPESRANKRVNGGLPGMTFTSLAATQNEQGRYSRSIGGKFVHVELETSVRMEIDSRELAATVIADTMRRAAEADRGDESETLLASFVSETDGKAGSAAADHYRTRTETSLRGEDDAAEVRLAHRLETGAAAGRKAAARRTLRASER